MSFLAPVFLWLGGAAAVPLLMHLLRRRAGVRVEFPAARYLVRTEREHRRTLRFRNLLLMIVRVAAILLLAMAAARPMSRWLGGRHAPTALAVVVDNSMSTGVIEQGHPFFEQIETLASDVLSRAAPGDRTWVVTSDGTVIGGGVTAVRGALSHLHPTSGAGDLHAAVARAAGLVRASGLDSRQVAVLTDGQRTSWPEQSAPIDARVLVWSPTEAPPPNRAVTLAEPRPIRWTPHGALVVRVQARDSTEFRVALAGQLLARGVAIPGADAVIQASPRERGWVSGTVEIDPDELAPDNVRYFAVWIGIPPGVSVSPGAGSFLLDAVDVLRRSGELGAGKDVAVVAADELTSLPVLATAPPDPVRLGVANRALERANIPWRFGARHGGAPMAIAGTGLDRVEVSDRYDLVPQSGAIAETLAVAGRDPWAVAGPGYVLVGSPITVQATTLPIRAAFIPWLATLLRDHLGGATGGVIAATPGARIARPAWADALESDSGERVPLGDPVVVPAAAGAYFLTSGARRVGALVVNAPAEESNLDRLSPGELVSRIHGARAEAVASGEDFVKRAFAVASGRSLVDPLLAAVLAMLLLEALVVTARRREAVA